MNRDIFNAKIAALQVQAEAIKLEQISMQQEGGYLPENFNTLVEDMLAVGTQMTDLIADYERQLAGEYCQDTIDSMEKPCTLTPEKIYQRAKQFDPTDQIPAIPPRLHFRINPNPSAIVSAFIEEQRKRLEEHTDD